MNRRNFFKYIGGAIGVAVTAPLVGIIGSKSKAVPAGRIAGYYTDDNLLPQKVFYSGFSEDDLPGWKEIGVSVSVHDSKEAALLERSCRSLENSMRKAMADALWS